MTVDEEHWELSTPPAGALGTSRVGGQSSGCLTKGSPSALLSSQLRKEYGTNVVPAFPPKKIFTLTPAEVEQRREQLEKYMQAGKWGLPRAVAQAGCPCLGRSEHRGTAHVFLVLWPFLVLPVWFWYQLAASSTVHAPALAEMEPAGASPCGGPVAAHMRAL